MFVLAIMGRPNVGKSTLFNGLTQSRQAIVADAPGVTRDRLYGEGKLGLPPDALPYIVIDTGGIGMEKINTDIHHTHIIQHTEQQAFQAASEADCLLFLVDAQAGLMPDDEKMAAQLRRLNKPIYLVVNKIDGVPLDTACTEFHRLGLGEPFAIAASKGRGVSALMAEILKGRPQMAAPTLGQEAPLMEEDGHFSSSLSSPLVGEDGHFSSPLSSPLVGEDGQRPGEGEPLHPPIRVAIIGRPNVGKSTLINRILDEERVLVADLPGTTRDSIFIPFEKKGQKYTLIDTAGVRRRAKVTETIEKFSVVKTLQAIESSQICVFLVDASEGITDQDLHLIGFIIEAGKALVIGINKWDQLSGNEKNKVREELDRRLPFANFANKHFLSALRGTGVNALFRSINNAYASAMKKLSTPQLTRILEAAVAEHPTPKVNHHRIKLRYAHPGGQNPPLIVIHGNQTQHLPQDYCRYLIHCFRTALKLSGTPIRLELKSQENPYAGKKNLLTPRQERKRKRLLKYYKKR